jgi:hypothetical protein
VNQLEHNGESLLLTNDNITDVNFVVKMTEEDKQDIVQLIANGPFNPRLWQVNTHPSQYKLDFETYKP